MLPTGTYSDARVNLRNAENNELLSAHEDHAEDSARRKRTTGTDALEHDIGYCEARAPTSHKKGMTSLKVLQVPDTLQISKCQPQNSPFSG